MTNLDVYGIREGSRTLQIVVPTMRAWFDIDQEIYAFERTGTKIVIFADKSSFTEAITNLRTRTSPPSLGIKLYLAMEAGQRTTLPLVGGYAETGKDLPPWLQVRIRDLSITTHTHLKNESLSRL